MSGNDPADRIAEEKAARLTARALGQVSEAERIETAASLLPPDDAEARRAVAEIRSIAEAARAARNEDLLDADAQARSQDLRRLIVARLAADPTPASPPSPPRRRTSWGLWAAVGSLAAAMLVLAMLPAGHDAARRETGLPWTRNGAGPAAAEDVRIVAMADRAAVDRATAEVAMAEEKAAEVAMADKAGDLRKRLVPPAETRGAAATSPSGPTVSGRLREPGARMMAPAPAARTDGLSFQAEPAAGERYARFEENRDRAVADEPLSTFSIDVDTASYANVRRFLSAGSLPPKDAVRIEELLNYFRYDDPLPTGDDPFSVSLEAAACPWHEGRRLVRIGIRGRDVERGSRPAGNLVFLIDVSGSMEQPDKLPLVKQALAMLVEELTENDRVTIVTYAGEAGLVLPPTTGDRKREILAAIVGLSAGGSTHGSAGVVLAYEQAAKHFIAGGANRVILATDGDLNVGVTSDAALVDLIRQQAAGGTFLTVLGFGRGNLQDEKMEKLADNGNGVYAFIDGAREARKVLVEQLTGSTITIAKDVKLQVEFNPARVASYRLVGYENRLLAARDFRDDRKDAGEIGAGHTATVLYEIVPAGAEPADDPAGGAEPLKYQGQPEPKPEVNPRASATLPPSDELLTVKLRFKRPDGDTSMLREFPLADRGAGFDAASNDLRFAAAVAAFGMLLRDSQRTGEFSIEDVARVAGRAIGRDEGGYRAEFLDLVRKAASLQRRQSDLRP